MYSKRFLAFAVVVLVGVALSIKLFLRSDHPDSATVAEADRNLEFRSTSRKGELRSGNNSIVELRKNHSDTMTLDQALASVKEKGDYGELSLILGTMPETERSWLLLGEFMRVESRRGVVHDCSRKLEIIEKFGGQKSQYLKSKLLKTLGSQFGPVSDNALTALIGVESWKTIVTGAAEQDVARAFDLCIDLADNERKITGCAEVARVWLAHDSIAASARISEMENGRLKDAAISELVKWLVGNDDVQSTAPWIEQISNEELRENIRNQVRR